jgi:hypothetical protein
MSAVSDEKASGKEAAARPEEETGREESGAKSNRRRRPRVSAKQVAHGAKIGTDAVRSRIASIVWLVAVACAVVLALAAVLTALSPANQDNSVVEWLTSSADVLAGPLGGADGGVFDFGRNEEAKNALANWGLAAIVYLVIGRVLDRIIRP